LVSIESAYTTFYYLLIVTVVVSPTVFEILTFKARKWLFPLPYLTPPFGRNPLEFLDETYRAKFREIVLPYGENFIIRGLVPKDHQ